MIKRSYAQEIEYDFYKLAQQPQVNPWQKALQTMDSGLNPAGFSQSIAIAKEAVGLIVPNAKKVQESGATKEEIIQAAKLGGKVPGVVSASGEIDVEKLVKFSKKFKSLPIEKKAKFLKKAGISEKDFILKKADETIAPAKTVKTVSKGLGLASGLVAEQAAAKGVAGAGIAAGAKGFFQMGAKVLSIAVGIYYLVKGIFKLFQSILPFTTSILSAKSIGINPLNFIMSKPEDIVGPKLKEFGDDPTKMGILGYCCNQTMTWCNLVIDGIFSYVIGVKEIIIFIGELLFSPTVLGSIALAVFGTATTMAMEWLNNVLQEKQAGRWKPSVTQVRTWITSKIGGDYTQPIAQQTSGDFIQIQGDSKYLYKLTPDNKGYTAYLASNRAPISGGRVFTQGLEKVLQGTKTAAEFDLASLLVKKSSLKSKPFGRG